jgi:predicted nucleotidyltransferase
MRHDDLPQALIFLCLHGSQAYGTATPTSDWDVRGVGIAPLTTYFGTRPWEQIQGGSPFLEQLLYDKHPQANNGDELDSEVFNVTKFVRLAADANPNILDILFAHPDDWLHTTPAWEMLHEKRHMFLSMRVRHTYTGYAMQDYFAMVHGRPFDPNGEHERQQASLQGSVEQELFKRLEAERKYKHALNHWKQYQGWLKQRNAARAKLESQFGYDAKHASHLVRLLLSVQEILTEGNLSVRHPHAQLLRDVRGGAWSYDELIEWANEQEQIIHKLSAEKPLRHSPDRDAIDQLITDMVMTFHGKQ